MSLDFTRAQADLVLMRNVKILSELSVVIVLKK